MTKTLTLNTCKKLFDAGIEVETDKHHIYYDEGYHENNKGWGISSSLEDERHRGLVTNEYYPAPNLEEVIELLPSGIHLLKYIDNKNKPFYDCNSNRESFHGKTPLEAVEQMINHLLDNNLLKK